MSDTERDPRLVTVCWSGDGSPINDILHRYDESVACGNMPSTNVSTDLTTAAVTDGNELCPSCEWPDGSEKVLEGRYVDTDTDQTEADQ